MDFILLIAFALLMWLLFMRPASKRAKQVRDLQSGLAVGDRIMLTSGIFGTVVELRDSRLLVSIAPGSEIEVVRQAVAQIEQPEQNTSDEVAGEVVEETPDADASVEPRDEK